MSDELSKGGRGLAQHFGKSARFHKAKSKAHGAASDAHDAMCEAHKGIAANIAKTLETIDLAKAEGIGPGIEDMMKSTVSFHKAAGAFHKAMAGHHGGVGKAEESYSEHCFKMSGRDDKDEDADDDDDRDDDEDDDDDDRDDDKEKKAVKGDKVADKAVLSDDLNKALEDKISKATEELTKANAKIAELEGKINKLESVPEPIRVKGAGPQIITRDNKVVKAERVNVDDESGGLRAN